MGTSEVIYIYGLWCPITSELRYIGRSNNPNLRLSAHISEAHIRKGDNPRKEKWIRDLSRENLKPLLEILEECNEDNYEEIEIIWITEAKSKGANLFNVSKGGDGWLYGKDHPMHGRRGAEHHSYGSKASDETKRKMSQARLGRVMSEETKKKLSEALRGRKRSDEVRKKMSEGRTGCKVTPFTEEHKRRISEAHKRRNEAKRNKDA